MAINFNQTSQFEKRRSEIEAHLYSSVLKIENSTELALRSIDQFEKAISRFFDILEMMYQNPNHEEALGEKSFPVKDGRYRIFYKIQETSTSNLNITLLDIDDNKQSNIDRFPTHSIISFDD
jgi:negative regulator of replication initiation